MANAKCCDRCGKFYINNKMIIDIRVTTSPIIGISYETRNGQSYPIIDLCDECLTELIRWVKGVNSND